MELKRIAGENCWACSSEPAQICPVVAKEDPQVGKQSLLACLDYDNNIQARFWAEKGLINFSLVSAMNAIPLCPLCHYQFDLALDLGFVFYSTLSTSDWTIEKSS